MKWTKKMLLFLTIVAVTNTYAQNTILIPRPLEYSKGNGSYTLPKQFTISCSDEAKPIANEISNTLQNIQGVNIHIQNTKGNIQLQLLSNDMALILNSSMTATPALIGNNA